ncbi:hypothetical protein JTE90_020030 [Oedothorax gibbosus]|uniref:Kazal-like domain-containing protein n=1 Tax=Oedothorax gibbosus TaxID=931172 RepID=A0AAV6US52_9ARAC|nr:hypothetical protein JTE90_020030 [Oedothorax gibbosus]
MGNAKVKTLVVERPDECEPDYRTSRSDTGITSELKTPEKDKCSILELQTPVVEKPDEGEPDYRTSEGKAGIIPEHKKPSQNIFSIPELPGLKILEYANKVKEFIGLEDSPDVASDSPKSNEIKESNEHQSLKPERDENIVDDTEDVQASTISLCKPDIVDNTDESDIDIPIDDNESECFVVESKGIPVTKELGDKPVALAPIGINSNNDITNDKNLNDVDDISASEGLDDQPDTLSISNKNCKDLELSENDISGNISFDNKINSRLEAEKEDSDRGVTENNKEKDQINIKYDAISDSITKNDFQKLDSISKTPLSDSKININDLEIPETHYHDVCETEEKYLNCLEDPGDVFNQSDPNDEKIASAVNRSTEVSDDHVDSIKTGRESIGNINLNDSKANELSNNDNLVKLSNGSLDIHKNDKDSSFLKEPVLFFGEDIFMSSDTYNSSVNEEVSDPNLKFEVKDLVDNENCFGEINQDIEQNPNIEQLRRLSSGIAKSILDSAENELKNIKEDSQKEYYIDINQLSDEKIEIIKNNSSKEFDNSNSQETESEQRYPTENINQNLCSMALTTKIKESMGKSNAENYVDPDIVCGIGSFKPQWLQPWATARADVKVEECDEDDRPPTLAAVLFLMLGSFLKGFGNLAYYAVGLAYMDDNAKKKNTPIYFALAYALRLLGPLVGFLMSYSFLKYYENPFVDPGFGPEDPRWIGGWWMGFMVQGVLVMVFSAPIALFPRRLPGHKLAADTVRKGEGLVSNLAGLWAALKRLGKNPLYIFLVINTIFSVYGSFGHFIMLPKYMENQFRVSASQASLLSGPPGIAALIVSTLIGGYLIYRLRPNARFLTGCLVILEVIGAVGYLILMIPKCETIQMSNYGFDGQGLILEGACNANCSCTTKAFSPVCAPDGKTHFFSPCHAGCHEKVNQTFLQCSCIADSSDLGENSATEGFCITYGCWNQALAYIITLPILQFIVNLLRVADTMVFLRCIKTEDKSIALGTFETLLSAFGFIPYPIVFGALVDHSCLVWEKSCGQTGNCWFYDITKFNYLLHGGSALFSGLSALCMFVVFCLSGSVTDLYKDDEDLDENVKEGTVKEVKEEADASTTRI